MIPNIFCPNCNKLILNQSACTSCGWQRPTADKGAGEKVWSAKLGASLIKPYCYPVVARSNYCLPTEDGRLIALNRDTGQLDWERSLDEGHIAHALATDGGRVFAGPEDARPIPTPGKALLALDARSGQELWQHPTPAHSLSGAALAGGTLYFSASDGLLRAVDAVSGQERWTAPHPAWGPATPAAGEGLVCVGGRGDTLAAFAAEDGKELWRFAGGDWFATRPCIAGGCVYALCWDGYLYALDARSGKPVWKFEGERGKGITSPLAVVGERVFVGSRVYGQAKGQQTATYALLALTASGGDELWRFYTGRRVSAPPAAAGGVVFFGADDGWFYAVDAADGKKRWRMQLESRLVTAPQVEGDVVYFGEREGAIHAVRWRVSSVAEMSEPAVYERQGQYAEASVAHALRGEFEKAATIYEVELDKYHEAAQLYERAGRPGKAAPLWARVGDLARARDLYREAGDQIGLAGVLERMNEPLRAAQLYEQVGELEQAVRLYQQVGDRPKSAELYERLEQPDKAQEIWESLGYWEKQVESLIASGKLIQAAQVLETQNQLERAAVLYEEDGQLEQALKVQIKLERWEKVTELAHNAGDHQQQAEAQERLGHPARAAQAYVRAARQLMSDEAADGERIARLWERAAQLYGDVFEEERSADCRRMVLRYRKMPEIIVQGEVQEAFREYEWNTLSLQVKNTGYGIAHDINITFQGAFDVEGECDIRGLPQGGDKALELFVRPHRGHYGPKVPLEITVTYQDSTDEQYQATQRLPVSVVQQGISPGTITPMEIKLRPSAQVESFTAVVRELLSTAFKDDELSLVCFDHFRSVYEEFGDRMKKSQKIHLLVEHCARHQLFDLLLAQVRERNPAQYTRFEAKIQSARRSTGN